ncbi:flexible cuticle protein 12-like [Culicoides brevitarsis]|uniref:flexible cuticle protein 12-like n=1 Tax=Culicoides brevitarsis TaxID=469753 RepID=UPI00307B8467
MKFAIVLVALFAVALARPNKDAETVRFDVDNIGVDGYKYGYETSNGIKHEESGVVNNVGAENEAISVRGSFSYVADDGQTYTVNYVADENGFQPEAAHIPKAE